MYRIVAIIQMLSLAVAASGWAAEPQSEQKKAIAEIEKLGGRVTLDEKSPEKSVIGVNLTDTMVTDAGLEHLKGLTELKWLGLTGTKVTDAGLEQLKGLTELQWLDLVDTKVSNEGVKNLQQALPKCKIFN